MPDLSIPDLSLDERFAVALHNTARAWRQTIDSRLKDLGVSQAAWLAIATIAKSPGPLSQSELAHHLSIEGATMVAMVDRLTRAGYVERVASPGDRRVKRVVLTPAGLTLHGRVREKADEVRHDLLDGFDRIRLQAATELLEALHRRVDT